MVPILERRKRANDQRVEAIYATRGMDKRWVSNWSSDSVSRACIFVRGRTILPFEIHCKILVWFGVENVIICRIGERMIPMLGI